MLRHISPFSFNVHESCSPISYGARVKDKVLPFHWWGELNRAIKASKELQSCLQGQLPLLTEELDIKRGPFFPLPVLCPLDQIALNQ